jgi:tetratricopeptide (TPR) repeat protein
MTRLGFLYANGYGVAQDYAKAREWYEKAADKGDGDAMTALGLLYDNGHGVAQDYAKAREWYEKAADKGDRLAMVHLGLLYEHGNGIAQDYAKAREWYGRAADKGEAAAMTLLGLLYDTGHGVTQNYVEAREWYEKAVNGGDTGAMTFLGLLYQNGHGVTQDDVKAREWYEKGADKGDTLAMVYLGGLYENGQDYAKAREWYEKAANRGDADAGERLESLPIRKAAGTGRYADALRLDQALAAKIETAETERSGKPGEATAEALSEVAWYALFAREYPRALTAAERAHALLPAELIIETNRAHALMFLGRPKDAGELYLAHKGERLSETDGRLWEQAVAEDFAEFQKAGLSNPLMGDILRQLGVSR